MSVHQFNQNFFKVLTSKAQFNNRLRQHQNLHTSFESPTQKFFNAIEPESYIRPHQHSDDQGPEMLVAIKGLMYLILFNDAGKIIDSYSLSTRDGDNSVLEIPSFQWHTVVSMESGSILLEVKNGPFNADSPKTFADWAPEEQSFDADVYLQELKDFIKIGKHQYHSI